MLGRKELHPLFPVVQIREASLVTDGNIISVGDPAPDVTLPDDSAAATSLSILWSERPLVLLFIRHLG